LEINAILAEARQKLKAVIPEFAALHSAARQAFWVLPPSVRERVPDPKFVVNLAGVWSAPDPLVAAAQKSASIAWAADYLSSHTALSAKGKRS
jgi:hypothetical protein